LDPLSSGVEKCGTLDDPIVCSYCRFAAVERSFEELLFAVDDDRMMEDKIVRVSFAMDLDRMRRDVSNGHISNLDISTRYPKNMTD
jgi:hypothetical protein